MACLGMTGCDLVTVDRLPDAAQAPHRARDKEQSGYRGSIHQRAGPHGKRRHRQNHREDYRQRFGREQGKACVASAKV